MDNHPIDNLMKSTMESLRDMIDVNTIIGEAVETKEGSFIIPISKVSFGFASGGSEFKSKNESEHSLKYPFGGGSGAGVSVKPVAFLIIKGDNIRLLSVDHENALDRLVDGIPQIIEMLKGLGKTKDEKSSKDNKDKDSEKTCTTSDTI